MQNVSVKNRRTRSGLSALLKIICTRLTTDRLNGGPVVDDRRLSERNRMSQDWQLTDWTQGRQWMTADCQNGTECRTCRWTHIQSGR